MSDSASSIDIEGSDHRPTLDERIKIAVGGNVSAFAKKCGLSESLLRQYISGSTPGLTKAALVAKEAGVSLEWLATGEGTRQTPGTEDRPRDGEPEKIHSVPLFEHWREMLLWVREGELPDGVRRVEAKPQLGPRAFALPVRSRIMAPLFPAGARIIVDPAQSEQTDAFVVVQVEGWDEATFRRLVMDAGRTYLEPLNTDYRTIDISDEQYTYCGRVVWMELNLLNPLL